MFTKDRIHELRATHGRTMAKYLAGSVVALIVSTATFSVTFGTNLLGSKSASLTASATGAVTNYFLNRNWAWGRRGRADVRTELIPYWRTVIITAIAAAMVTGAVNALLRDLHTDRSMRTLLNTIAFVGTYGVSFLVKYRMFDRLWAGPARRRTATTAAMSAPVIAPGIVPGERTQPASSMSSAGAKD